MAKQQQQPWLEWTNCQFSGSINILIGCYFCHSSAYKIMTGPTAGSKWSLIPCPLGHNKLPFTCKQIKYTRLVRQGDKKGKMLLQNGLLLQWDGTTQRVLFFCPSLRGRKILLYRFPFQISCLAPLELSELFA